MSDLLALVFTDVVDSTLLNDRLGDEVMGRLWAEHDHCARELVRHWRGREVGRSDGFLLLFNTAADAAGFALAYQQALRHLTVPLMARVGVHFGPVTLRHNAASDTALGATPFEVDGLALPAAARVMSAALGGQILLSAQAHAALGAAASQTVWHTVSHGHWRFKGLDQPMELFEICPAGAAMVPPADSAKAYRVVRRGEAWLPARELPHSLPAERDVFVGRSEELHALAQLFESGARLVTLHGLGGIGKTRLSQHYARLWLGDHPGGAWFCDLSAARSADAIVHAVAQGLGVPLGRADPVQQLGAAIAGRGPCLVILDNFEQVAAFAEQTLGAWLESAPQARFIVTSRELLGIVGEQVYLLPPLADADAVAMFRLRVRSAGGQGQFAADDEAALSPLMELLDRLPLAIELAAARARLLSPRMLLQRMGDRFKLLAARLGRRDRQATMRAALDWSWALLSPVEQSALAQLSVFEGGFTLEAAEAVVDLSQFRLAPEVVNVLQSLLEKSLLRQGDKARLEMLRTVHDYAADSFDALARVPLHPATQATQAPQRHMAFFASLWRKAAEPALCVDLDNLVAAVRRAMLAGRVDDAVGALHGAWLAFKLRGPFQGVIELCDAVRHAPLELSPAALAQLDWFAGWALKATGRVAEAEQRLLSSLAAARGAGDSFCEGHVLGLLGELLNNAGRIDEAREALNAALVAAQQSGNLGLECEAATGLGSLHRNLGTLVAARSHYEAALATARCAGDRRREGGCLGNLGVMHANEGLNAEAEACYRDALAIARELGDRQWEGNTLCNLGLLHHVLGRYDAAAEELSSALHSARELGHVRLECIVLCNLGMTVEAMGRPSVAFEHYAAALGVARRLGDGRSEGQILGYLGLLQARQQRFAEARTSLKAGEALLVAAGDRLSLALLLCGRAECEHLASEPHAAQAALAQAQALCSDIGAETGSELQLSLARVQRLIP